MHVVSSATSGERGVTTTILCCYAVGNYVPQMMIFKGKYVKPEITDNAPAGTLNTVSENGWINGPLFVNHMEHFVKNVKPSKENKVLLILDGHSTQTINIAMIEYASENGIVMLSLPPHTSHKLQPLDRTFFKPLKSAFNTPCMSWIRSHQARRIVVDQHSIHKIHNN